MIPFLDIKKLNTPYKEELERKFIDFLDRGWYILGKEVKLFEQEYANYCETKYCVGTANGLDALRIILEGYKILKKINIGDEVLVASNTYIATILAIKQAGLVPVLVEANEDTFNFDFEDLESKITYRTKVVLPTHLYGLLTDMDRVKEIAASHNLLVITDCAQSHGARKLDGKRSGSLGNAGAHSFYPTKNLGALGDAGAITTDDESLAEVVRDYRNYGFNLDKKGIETIIHYPVPPHRQEALKELVQYSLPICDKIHQEVLSISTDSTLSDTQVNEIIKALNDFVC